MKKSNDYSPSQISDKALNVVNYIIGITAIAGFSIIVICLIIRLV